MKRVFVYEYLSGGGLAGLDEATQRALLPEGTAMRDALVADLLRVRGLSVSVAGCAAASVPPRGAALVVPRAGETPFDFVTRIARGHDLAWVVAPETGGVLLDLCRRVGAARWLGCSAAAIAVAGSKRATAGLLARHGIATPSSFAASHGTAHWVVKPDDGAGALATRRFADRSLAQDEHMQRAATGEAVVLEPWVGGEALSLSLLCGPDGAELLSVNRQRIDVEIDGHVRFDGVALDVMPKSDPRRVRLAQLANDVAAALPGLRGFVGIDLVWHPDAGPVVIEINPRVTSAYVGLSAALGRNLGAAAIEAHAGAETVDG